MASLTATIMRATTGLTTNYRHDQGRLQLSTSGILPGVSVQSIMGAPPLLNNAAHSAPLGLSRRKDPHSPSLPPSGQRAAKPGLQRHCQTARTTLPRRSLKTAETTREELEEELEASLRQAVGVLSEDMIPLVEQLEAMNPTANSTERLDLFNGTFEMLNTSIPGLFNGSMIPVGRLSFGFLGPRDLEVRVIRILTSVNKETTLYTHDIEFDLEQSAVGCLSGAVSTVSAVQPGDGVNFWTSEHTATRLAPSKGTDLRAWLELFKPANKGMSDDGKCEAPLPPFPTGFDISYLSEKLRITKGYNMQKGKLAPTGNRVILKRVK